MVDSVWSVLYGDFALDDMIRSYLDEGLGATSVLALISALTLRIDDVYGDIILSSALYGDFDLYLSYADNRDDVP